MGAWCAPPWKSPITIVALEVVYPDPYRAGGSPRDATTRHHCDARVANSPPGYLVDEGRVVERAGCAARSGTLKGRHLIRAGGRDLLAVPAPVVM
jgi:hypothetical protein